ncbi:hypothetical protein IFM89_019065 [Coptis chinensis]|uniref:Uncharacterized protein n=1 Tax=Coptis chinensis TaxID=261450 RepID=A0A835IU15_9MAGN|nr:hypothetical protein IFM89_019065 [Coptis chinensis]
MKEKTRKPKELLPNLMSHAHFKLLVKMGFVERH